MKITRTAGTPEITETRVVVVKPATKTTYTLELTQDDVDFLKAVIGNVSDYTKLDIAWDLWVTLRPHAQDRFMSLIEGDSFKVTKL